MVQQQTVHNFEFKALAAKKGCGTESESNGMLWNYIVWNKNDGEDMPKEDTKPVDPEALKYVNGSFKAICTANDILDGDISVFQDGEVTLNIGVNDVATYSLVTLDEEPEGTITVTGPMPSLTKEEAQSATSLEELLSMFDGDTVIIDNATYVITNDSTDTILTFTQVEGTYATAPTDYSKLLIQLEVDGTALDVLEIDSIVTPVLLGEDTDEPTEAQLTELDNTISAALVLKAVTVAENASEVDKGEQWVTREVMDALEEAIDEATAVRDTDGVTGTQIEEATADLNDALDIFAYQIKRGTKEEDTDEPTQEQLDALDEAIAAAEELKSTPVDTDASNVDKDTLWVTQETMNELITAINSAVSVREDADATGTTIEEATTDLNDAVDTFIAARQTGTKEDEPADVPTDEQLEGLADAIATAEALVETTVDTDAANVEAGTDWVTQDELDALSAVLETAKGVRDTENVTGTAVTEAASDLEDAIEVFTQAIKKGTKEEPPVVTDEPTETQLGALNTAILSAESLLTTTVDTDAENVPEGTNWTTQADVDTLQDEVDSAKAVRDTEGVTGAEIEAATTALNEAIETFIASLQTGTKSLSDYPTLEQIQALNELIEDAQEMLEMTVDTDEANVPAGTNWVTQDDMTALQIAVSSAESLVGDEETTGTEMEEATEALSTAIDTFASAIRVGTKVEEEPPVVDNGPTEEELQDLDTAITTANALLETAVDTDAENVDAGTQWVTQETMDALEAAIETAETARNAEDATSETITGATTALNESIDAFNGALQEGTKSTEDEGNQEI